MNSHYYPEGVVMTAENAEDIKAQIDDARAELVELRKRANDELDLATSHTRKGQLLKAISLLDAINPVWLTARDAYNAERDADALIVLLEVFKQIEKVKDQLDQPEPIQPGDEAPTRRTYREPPAPDRTVVIDAPKDLRSDDRNTLPPDPILKPVRADAQPVVAPPAEKPRLLDRVRGRIIATRTKLDKAKDDKSGRKPR
jgi:hypothetical protein